MAAATSEGGTGRDDRHFVPTWDGKPETFGHFVTEVKWTLSSSKRDDRALLAARIIRKALQSEHKTLVQLMYKLEPENFKTEASVNDLVKFLEESPLNRQPLPDAGAKIGGYYRRFQRKHNEALPSFLVREDKIHDDMLRALQRLLRERELNFTDYDTTVEELKEFCGMATDESMYYGPPEGTDAHDDEDEAGGEDRDEDDERDSFREGSRRGRSARSSSRSSAGSPAKGYGKGKTKAEVRARGKDLLQRLMEKGLMPLAALDVIRGWMILEMSTSSEEERRVVKAATQNRLGYHEVKQALLAMYEDRGKGHSRPFAGGAKGAFFGETDYPEGSYDDGEAWWPDDQWSYYQYGDPGPGDEEWAEGPDHAEEEADEEMADDDAMAIMQQEQREFEEQRRELELMMAENDRNLAEARRAVAQAAKDRGWTGTVQQRQFRPTSQYMQKGKGFGKPGKGKGSKGAKMAEEVNWTAGKKGSKGGRPGFSKGKSKPTTAWSYHLDMGDNTGAELFSTSGGEPRKEGTALKDAEALVDTGATSTAGGSDAVQKLCAAIAAAHPGVKVDIHSDVRPYFRYGSGKWGRALFKVVLSLGGLSMEMFALPSEGVPVLLGMRELRKLKAVIGCESGRCLIAGKRVRLKQTPKGHLVIDIVKQIFGMKAPRGPLLAHASVGSTPTKRTLSHYWVPKGQAPKSPVHALQAPRKKVMFSNEPPEHQSYLLELDCDEVETVDYEEEQFVCEHEANEEAEGTEAQYMGLNDDDLCYVNFGSSTMSSRWSRYRDSRSPPPLRLRERRHGQFEQRAYRRDEGRGEEGRARGDQRDHGRRWRDDSRQGREEPRWRQDGVRCRERDERGRPRPSSKYGRVAVPRTPPIRERREPFWQVDRMPGLRLPQQVRAGQGRARGVYSREPSNEHHGSTESFKGRDPELLEAKDVKSMITIVAKEKRLLHGKPKSKAAPPAKFQPRPRRPLEPPETIESQDEGFDRVDLPSEDGEEKETTPRESGKERRPGPKAKEAPKGK